MASAATKTLSLAQASSERQLYKRISQQIQKKEQKTSRSAKDTIPKLLQGVLITQDKIIKMRRLS